MRQVPKSKHLPLQLPLALLSKLHLSCSMCFYCFCSSITSIATWSTIPMKQMTRIFVLRLFLSSWWWEWSIGELVSGFGSLALVLMCFAFLNFSKKSISCYPISTVSQSGLPTIILSCRPSTLRWALLYSRYSPLSMICLPPLITFWLTGRRRSQ